MAQIDDQHVAPITSGFVGLLVLGAIVIGVLNYSANKR